MTTLSRSSRACVSPERVMRPSRTMQPAIVPNFGTLNVSRTSALPSRTSRSVGSSRPGHRLLHLVDDVVDDRVQADIDLVALGHVRRVAIGPDVEADDDGVRRGREQHVRFVDRADAAVDDADLHPLVAQLRERVGEHFGRPLHVGLDDDRQLLHAAFGDLLLQRLEREPAALGAERPVLGLPLRDTSRSDAPWRRPPAPGRRRPAAAARRGRALRPAWPDPRS